MDSFLSDNPQAGFFNHCIDLARNVAGYGIRFNNRQGSFHLYLLGKIVQSQIVFAAMLLHFTKIIKSFYYTINTF